MSRSSRPACLNGIEIKQWVHGTARKMLAAKSESRATWNEAWFETYLELGGQSRTTGEKGCPKSAAYGLWSLGLLAGVARNFRKWSIAQVRKELGKNAAYAVIAAELMTGGAAPTVPSLWPRIRKRYEELTGEEAARSEQGEIRLVIALYCEAGLQKR